MAAEDTAMLEAVVPRLGLTGIVEPSRRHAALVVAAPYLQWRLGLLCEVRYTREAHWHRLTKEAEKATAELDR